jgi:xanthine dehydrogenase iron-sulfur cluster and FAD-binding subunit A
MEAHRGDRSVRHAPHRQGRGPKLRSIAELIETLRLDGRGLGLSTGCAAGDTGAALVLEVTA